MSTLKNKITALTDSIAQKMNELNAAAEKNANKRQNLEGADPNSYPSVPAVNAGLASALASANSYTDAEFAKYPHIVSDEFYVATDNNYTNAEKAKLASLETSKFLGQYTSLTALQTAHPNPPVGSYGYVDLGEGELVVKYIWDTTDNVFVLQQGESAELSPSQIKSAYESNADTNAFTDAEKTAVSLNSAHRSATDNPHNVTKAQVGLGNVDNTSDINKPVSTAQASAINVVQLDLNTYRLEVGTNFPDYTAQFVAAVNF